jgi:phosphoglycolate phosphatase
MNKIKLLICDLDNTLYDWVGYFVPSFYAMVDSAVEIIGCDKEKLLDDLKRVHQIFHDTEHPFSLLDTDIVAENYKGMSRKEVAGILDPAFYAFNKARIKNLDLYPGVFHALERIYSEKVTIVAHTDSQIFGVVDRLRRLKIVDFFSAIYCREKPETNHPASDTEKVKSWFDDFPMHKIYELSNNQMKPNKAILKEICKNECVCECQAIYIGDSLSRDVLMAKNAGIYSVWAKYGAVTDSEDYRKLVRISHWTKQDKEMDVQHKREAKGVFADHTIEKSFDEILNILFD